jgi:hypothetical protein
MLKARFFLNGPNDKHFSAIDAQVGWQYEIESGTIPKSIAEFQKG